MNTMIPSFGLLVALALPSGPAFGQRRADPQTTPTDSTAASRAAATVASVASEKQILDQLVARIRKARRAYKKSLEAASRETQGAERRMSHQTTAHVLLRKERLDALETQLLAHCAMMEIPVPDTSLAHAAGGSAKAGDTTRRRKASMSRARDDQQRVRLLLQATWRGEARALMQRLRLPLLVLKPR